MSRHTCDIAKVFSTSTAAFSLRMYTYEHTDFRNGRSLQSEVVSILEPDIHSQLLGSEKVRQQVFAE